MKKTIFISWLLKRESHTLAGTKPFELYQFFIVKGRFLGFNRNILMPYTILSKFITCDRKSESILAQITLLRLFLRE